MPLERLILRNFQSHDKLVVDFDPKVTVVVGPSDVGKSAIIRALRWVATNKPGGDAFIKEGTKVTTVTLTVDGHRIDRRRAIGGDNVYRLDEDELRAFGADVPAPVSDLLRMSEVNFQNQHDTPFWFAESSGEVSRRLNAVVDLSTIDELQSSVTSKARQAKTVADLAEARLTELKQKKDTLKAIETTHEELKRVEALELNLSGIRHEYEMLSEFLHALDKCRAAMQESSERSALLTAAVQSGKSALAAQTQHEVVSLLLQKIRDNRALARRTAPDTSQLEAAKKAVDLAQSRCAALKEMLDEYGDAFSRCRQATAAASKAHTEFHQATKDERCPLCQHPLT
jgi:exonuclease SbcC